VGGVDRRPRRLCQVALPALAHRARVSARRGPARHGTHLAPRSRITERATGISIDVASTRRCQMGRALNRAGTAMRAHRHLALAVLVTLSSLDCGGTPSDANSSASAGTTQGGSSAAGTSGASHAGSGGNSGSVASGGTASAGDTAGEAGEAGDAAAAGAAGSGSRACGEQTCGANQYCRAPCSGTGFGGGQSLGPATCGVLPPACNGVPSCDCICGSGSSFCTPGAFEVQCGCA
jgi:hypothetical protein